MTIDFNTSDGVKKYLDRKLDDLLPGVNENYVNVLLHELVLRMEVTIQDFKKEMKLMFEDMKQNEVKRQLFLQKVKIGNPKKSSGSDKMNVDSSIISEWEKRLEEIENKR